MKTREKFSKRLNDERDKLRLSQPEMAKLIGLEERQYVNYENGEYDENDRLVKKYTNRLEEALVNYEKQKNAAFMQEGSAELKIAALEARIKRLEDDMREMMRRTN